jgi:hypothetical protein
MSGTTVRSASATEVAVRLVSQDSVSGGAAQVAGSFFDTVVDHVEGASDEVELVLPMPVPGGTWVDSNVSDVMVSYDTTTSTVHFEGEIAFARQSARVEINVTHADGDYETEVTISVDQLTLGDAIAAVADHAGVSVTNPLPNEPFELQDVALFVNVAEEVTVSLSARRVFMGAIESDVLVSITEGADGRAMPLVSMHVQDWTIGELVPAAAQTPVAQFGFPDVAVTVMDHDAGGTTGITRGAADLDPAVFEFYRRVYGTDDFSVTFHPGVSVAANMPLSHLPPALLNVLNLDDQAHVIFEGTLGVSSGWTDGNAEVERVEISAVLPIPHLDMPGMPEWLSAARRVERAIDFTYEEGHVALEVSDVIEARLDGADRRFVFKTDVSVEGDDAAVTLEGRMDGAWAQPFGIHWLTLDEVVLAMSMGDDEMSATLQSSFELGDRQVDIDMEIAGGDGDRTVTVSAQFEELSLHDVAELFERQGLNSPLNDLPINPALHDARMTIKAGSQKAFNIGATVEILDQEATLLVSIAKIGGQRRVMAAMKIDEFSLGAVIPALEGTLVDEFSIDGTCLVFARGTGRVNSDDLTAQEREFFGQIYGTDDFRLNIQSGLNLFGSIPLAGNPLTASMDSLGVAVDRVVLEGALPLGILGGSGGFDIRDLTLRAGLPPMRPAFAPEWFVSGQLAIEITAAPSIGFVGEITVDIEGDLLTFALESKIARSGANVEVALIGGLYTDEPWIGPFGIDWMTFNKAVIKLSINAAGNMELGFAGDVVIGEKDIACAVEVGINVYTGVPTNFMFDGASEEGVALSDLADLQAKMRAASGLPASIIPLDRLPDIAVKNLHLKFAPKDDPDLGVEAGFAISGDLYMQRGLNGPMERMAGIDVSLSLDGIYGEAYLGAIDIGGFTMDEAQLLLELNLLSQQLVISGGVDLGNLMSGHVDLDVSRDGLSFATSTTVFNAFAADVAVDKEFSFTSPRTHVEAAMGGTFISHITRNLGDAASAAFGAASIGIEGAQAAVTSASTALGHAETALQNAQAAADVARGVVDNAGAVLNEAIRCRNNAKRARDRAYSSYRNTSNWKPALKAARWADYAAKNAFYVAKSAAVRTATVARDAALAAFVPMGNALEAAEHAANNLQSELDAKVVRLQQAQDVADALANLETTLSIEYAGFTMDRDGFIGSGSAVELQLDVTFNGHPLTLAIDWDFSAPIAQNVKGLVDGLVSSR